MKNYTVVSIVKNSTILKILDALSLIPILAVIVCVTDYLLKVRFSLKKTYLFTMNQQCSCLVCNISTHSMNCIFKD